MSAIAGNIAKAQTLADGSLRLYVDLGEVNPAHFPWLFTTGQAVGLVALKDMPEAAPQDVVPHNPVVPHGTTDNGSLAQQMHIKGYFNNPRLWDALEAAELYTQLEHKEWIQRQPCFQQNAECQGDVVMHHVRTSANSGVGMKPPHWFGIPLCHHHHMQFHEHGSREVRNIMLDAAVAYMASQTKYAIKQILQRESLSGITDEELNQFERGIGFNSGLTWASSTAEADTTADT